MNMHVYAAHTMRQYMDIYTYMYILPEHPTTTEVAVGKEPTQLRRTQGRAESGNTQDTRGKFDHAREITSTNAYRQLTDMLCTTYWLKQKWSNGSQKQSTA